MMLSLSNDDAILLQPTIGFECGERALSSAEGEQAKSADSDDSSDDYDGASPLPVIFHCSFPIRKDDSLRYQFTFGCRRPSYGVLNGTEDSVDEGDFDASAGDPNFFDKGYTLAGSTGFCVWAGARFMLDSLVSAPTNEPTLNMWQQRIEAGARVVELGAGVGLLGTGLAAAGAEVLLTDLPSLVDCAIRPNIRRNARLLDEDPSLLSPPQWLAQGGSNEVRKIGKGWAAATPLDWSEPLDSQIQKSQLEAIDVIVASDCVWLPYLLGLLLDTVAALFENGASSFLLGFQRRDHNVGSTLFTSIDHLFQVVQERKWKISNIAWRPGTFVRCCWGEDHSVFARCIQTFLHYVSHDIMKLRWWMARQQMSVSFTYTRDFVRRQHRSPTLNNMYSS
jgi:predicted nicotinamide N-methyase